MANPTFTIELRSMQQWIAVQGRNYGLRTVTHCPTCLKETFVIEGESHDEEPYVSQGTYHCATCHNTGVFTSDDGDGMVGEHGILPPVFITCIPKGQTALISS